MARLLLATAAFTVLAVVPSAFAWTVTMTAEPALKRTHHWTIEKSTSTPTVTLGPGQTASVSYSVTVATTGFTDSDWSVSGLMEMSDDAKITVNSVVFKVDPGGAGEHAGDPGGARLHADDLPGRPRHRRARVHLQRGAAERGSAAGLDAGDGDP